MNQVRDVSIEKLPDGRLFIADHEVASVAGLRPIIERMPHYWQHDFRRCGFVGPVELEARR
ncbi:MAG TPA: hypothetical protein VIJ94_19930 [Caulobacteraceae bacterium]